MISRCVAGRQPCQTSRANEPQLYITYSRGLNDFLHWEERHKATLQNIHRAILTSPEPIPNMEFSIKINDRIELNNTFPNVTTWTFSRNISDPVMEQVWLMPDFNFWAYPRVAPAYGEYQRQALEIGDNFAAKKDLLVWRGTIAFNPIIRGDLLKQTENQTWSDVKKVAEDSDDEESLWSCHSVVFIHKLSHYTHLYHLLESSGPGQNYVPVENDFVDLPAKMEGLLANQAEAKRIADNAASKFRDRYVTPAAQTCYWRRLLDTWASLTDAPELYEEVVGEDGEVGRRWRPMLTFEEYLFYKEDFPVQPNKTEIKNGL